MQRGIINRSPSWFIAGTFMLAVGLITWSFPLILLAMFDIGIGFYFFLDPDIADSKRAKLFVLITYGLLIIWNVFWLYSKMQ